LHSLEEEEGERKRMRKKKRKRKRTMRRRRRRRRSHAKRCCAIHAIHFGFTNSNPSPTQTERALQ
jgi:hypothetical protein